jgi:hypothetical protein
VFPEEISDSDAAECPSLKFIEVMQAFAADFIVVIQASAGSIAEVHDTGALIDVLGSKMLVFVDKETRFGYSYRGLLSELNRRFSNVQEYQYPDDVVRCHLLTRVLEQVELRRWSKWYLTAAEANRRG